MARIFLLLFISIGCTHIVPVVHQEISRPHTDWIHSTKPIKAVAVTLHGLNMTTETMRDVGIFLANDGVKVLNVSLAGHRGTAEDFYKADRDLWLNECFIAYKQARNEANKLKVPLYFVGYSLGALVYPDLVSDPRYPHVRFDKMVLIAPPFATHQYTKLILPFSVLGEELVLPSTNLQEYRSNNGIPIVAFHAMFASQNALKEHRYKHLNIPILILIHPGDELVSPRQIRKIIHQYHLMHWHIETVDNSESLLFPHYAHLIIDETSMGKSEWARVTKLIAKHFNL